MKKINLRIAELRRAKNITQQQLAQYVGVSFQTISKWETGSVMPDITYLPVLAEYFDVTVDQLMGLVCLDGEQYIVSETGTGKFWDEKSEYLLRTRKELWNEDYMEFLITKVWKIDKPVKVLDCGCGYGFLGLLMLPFLPEGSTYTGVDFSDTLLETGKRIYEEKGIEATFIHKSIYDYHAKERYDLVISQAVLRHLDTPEEFIKKMISFAKKDAYIVCIETNRETECAGLYVEGMDYFRLCEHEGMKKHWKKELSKQGRDYAVAVRVAHLMYKLGLQEIDVRANDRVNFVTRQRPDYEQTKQDFLKYNDWDAELIEQEKEELIQYFMTHGMTRKDAVEYCERSMEISDYFEAHEDVGYTFVKGALISYGKK